MDELRVMFKNVNDDCITYLLKIACRESLRTAIKCYNATIPLCLGKNVPMTPKMLKMVQEQLFNERQL